LVHLVEEGNDAHRNALETVARTSVDILRWAHELDRQSSQPVVPGSENLCCDAIYQIGSDEDDTCDHILDPVTSSRISASDATRAVVHLTSGFPCEGHTLFVYREVQPSRWECTVHLPSSVPLKTITGPQRADATHARRAACYQACFELAQSGRLPSLIFPCPISLPSLVSTHLQTSLNGPEIYARKYPDFWGNSDYASLDRLYPTIIQSAHSSCAVLAILTRLPLPSLGDVHLFVQGIPTTVKLIQQQPFSLSNEDLQVLHRYTLRLCRAVTGKPFGCTFRDMPYFLAPLRSAYESDLLDFAAEIRWEQVRLAANSWSTSLSLDSHEALSHDVKDAIVQDKNTEFCRRYAVERLRTDMSPLSPPGESTVGTGSGCMTSVLTIFWSARLVLQAS
jgi:endoribonuclease Dicer